MSENQNPMADADVVLHSLSITYLSDDRVFVQGRNEIRSGGRDGERPFYHFHAQLSTGLLSEAFHDELARISRAPWKGAPS